MSLLEKCRDLTEDATLHTLAQSIYLWSLLDALERLGEDRSVEKFYLDSKLAQFTGHNSLGEIERMLVLESKYVPPMLLNGSNYINNVRRPFPKAYIAVSGMNVDLRVKYTSLNVKLGNFIKHDKFLLSTTEELTNIDKHTFIYFQTKTKKELTKSELLTIVKNDLSQCPACVHGVLPFHIVGKNGSSALTNLEDQGLSAESVSDNLLKDMRFKPERKHSKKG